MVFNYHSPWILCSKVIRAKQSQEYLMLSYLWGNERTIVLILLSYHISCLEELVPLPGGKILDSPSIFSHLGLQKMSSPSGNFHHFRPNLLSSRIDCYIIKWKFLCIEVTESKQGHLWILNCFWSYFGINIIFKIIFVSQFSGVPPLPDPEKFDSPP